MQKKLLLAINEGSEGFGFAWFKNEEKKNSYWIRLRTITETRFFFAIGNFRVAISAAWELVSQGWLFKRSWFGRRGWILRYREIKQRFFFAMHVHRKWKGLNSGWRCQKHFSASSPLLNAYPCFLCSRCMITGTRPKGLDFFLFRCYARAYVIMSSLQCRRFVGGGKGGG